ncbi:hypothetical protein GCK32_022151, partial [Trichostrongylus colubriformis]
MAELEMTIRVLSILVVFLASVPGISTASDGRSNVRPVFEAIYQDGWTIFGRYEKAHKV